jgi:AAA+ ATPase superfamily predicted ATPase
MSEEAWSKSEDVAPDAVEQVDTQALRLTVSSKTVYKAVRNILKNECKVDPEELRNSIRAEALTFIKTEIADYIGNKGYNKVNIDEWVRSAIDRKISDIVPLVKEVVKQLVQEHIREQTVRVIEGIIKDGIAVRVGWNHDVKVKVEEAK